ncbi:MAG: ABC transporter substrate-binding protein [Dehalococcoidales bacterium]|nr:MAG: ABC transporter substrate-binding protein [Dehalococcoidales bacterium]
MKKIIRLVIGCLMIITLIMTSCGGGEEDTVDEEEVDEGEKITVSLTKRDGTSMTRTVEKPIYGGTMLTALTADYGAWDPYNTQTIRVGHMQLTSNELIGGDWTLGPQGTGDTDWAFGWLGDIKVCAPELCDWELPDDTTILWHLKEGVKFQDKEPANGREMTADDIVFNFNYQFNNEGCWQTMEYPEGHPLRPISWDALDRYTVEVKFLSKGAQSLMLPEMGDNIYVSPPEVWTSGGDMNDWSKAVGSGPWILTDYVVSSAITYTGNPDYFEKDPIYASAGESNQWPYLDTFKFLVIPDTSTRIAALRTAELDFLSGISHDDATLLKRDVPDLQWKQGFVMSPMVAAGKITQPPYDDIRVRRALNMAINKQEMVDEYYGGEAALIGYPFPPGDSWVKVYTPLEEQPQEVKDIFTYNPEKAKQLLTDAGYPDGFKVKITCTTATSDELSLVKEYWADVGVELEMEVLEGSAWSGIWMSHGYEDMIYAPGLGCWAGVEQDMMTRAGFFANISEIDAPRTQEFKNDLARYILDDPDKMLAAKKEYAIWELQQAWGIFMPSAHEYKAWYPWVRNYYGINWTGGAGSWDWTKAIWIDQKMKTGMGY